MSSPPPPSTDERGPVRVLWLARGLGPGGMERLLLTHARLGDRARFRYTAAYMTDRPNSLIPELEEVGVRCIRLTGGSNPASIARSLRSVLSAEGIEVVHAHSPLPASIARVVARTVRPRPAVVYTEHNTWDCYGTATRWANRLTFGLDDAQLAVSREAGRSAPPRRAARVEVLTHGIDAPAIAAMSSERAEARAELDLSEEEVAVVVVAHLRAEKAYDVLLEAANQVIERRSEVVFLSVGHGPLEAELRERHRALGLGGRFRFLGFRPDAARVLAASDVFALASRQEGLPVSYMEACALGLPAVVTRVGGLVDYVVDGENGLSVPPEQPAALAEALEQMVGDAELRARCGVGARQTAEQFDARRAIARQEEIYSGLVR